jgi:hypothetical protein
MMLAAQKDRIASIGITRYTAVISWPVAQEPYPHLIHSSHILT